MSPVTTPPIRNEDILKRRSCFFPFGYHTTETMVCKIRIVPGSHVGKMKGWGPEGSEIRNLSPGEGFASRPDLAAENDFGGETGTERVMGETTP